MDLKLAGKTVLVTGSGQGLGRAIGLAFAAEGADVAFHYNSSSVGAEAAAKEASALGVRAIAVGADLRDGAAVQRAVDEIRDRLAPIDILVNNAAVAQSKPFLDSTEQDWEPQIDVNVTGALRVAQAVSRQMVDNGGGSIVTLMGDSGRVGESRLLVTATTRATTVGLTKSLAKELARHQIRANAVSIALVRTESLDSHTGQADEAKMKKILSAYPLRRLGTPDDVVPAVLLLASPLSSWTTGQIVSVNGGYAMP
ncbi:SDR family oxidoreductase [Streptomyces sp. DSM 41524]|uniref:SDR family oxidoreductase n=1 Tax=Streptomyces asiaticus subsp. ignotus TaxID=3098222 RepID=A0ABU7Q9J7_9ACTN|nr:MULTISPECIES: SDR family oxidoreductase [unclassified Streptomyces]MCG0284496.1 SDR family oxidoreductase [Streptomyces sp. PSAA01]MEE4598070.1 SDR family oxidoreductase [Streptomyces sp. DSM 41524]TMU98481.1 SDR family oxidoreductase [Streptomyces sp. DASNCL29]